MIEDLFTVQEFLEKFSVGDKLTPQQEEWISKFPRINLKGDRGSGRTSIGLGLILWTALKSKTSSIVVAATSQQVDALREPFLQMVHEVEQYLKIDNLVIRSSKDVQQLSNQSKIFFRVSNSFYFRGMSFDSIFLDLNLRSFDDLDEEFLLSVLPTLTCTQGTLIVSLEDK
jgi:hypothetical protein